MAAVLNSNVASMWASKNLQGAQSKMAESVERLSSGLRINRASDDAAGLGIANALTQQINGANQGVRNLNDGISMIQTAEGAIAAAQEMAQRILTLATQGANGTLGSNDRTAIQNEMKQLLTAINAIGGRTKFSNNSLLSFNPNAAAVSNQISLQVSNQTTDTISLSSNAFKNIGGVFGNVASTGGDAITLAGATTTMAMSSAPPASVTEGTAVYKVNYTTGAYVAVGEVSSVSGSNVILKQFTSTPANNVATAAVSWAADDTISFGGLTGGLLSYYSTAGATDLTLGQSVYSKSLTNSTASTATDAFNLVSKAASAYVTTLSSQRSLLGAYQNQIEFTVSNVNELSANLSAARSSVQDTDYASETASLTKGQILQQAATAMLAQANQMPNVILSLLK
jgi:flagellin